MARRRPWDPEPRYVTRALTERRRGSAGELRETVRCMLITLMGHDCGRYPPGKIPGHWGSRHPDERQIAIVAEDGLRELGYDAAADNLLRYEGRDPHTTAKAALEIFEAGAPSIYLDHYVVFRKPLYRERNSRGTEVVIAKAVGDHTRPWYRFLVGKPAHDRAGRWIGWDDSAGHTFQFRSKTLAAARQERA